MNSEMQKHKMLVYSLRIVFILMICTSLLPWFDRGDNAPAYWGFDVVMEHYLWIPFVFLIIFIWVLGDRSKPVYALLVEAAFAGVFGIYIYSVLYFKRYLWTVYEPDAAMDLQFGLSSTTASFWLSAVFVMAAFVLFQVYLYKQMKSEK